MRGLVVAALVPAMVWGLRPAAPSEPPAITLDTQPSVPALESAPDAPGELPGASVDPTAFTARLWNPKPLPPELADQPPTPSRTEKPEITLVAVIQTEGRLRAALYDPTDQRVWVLEPGAAIRQYTVSEITPVSVVIKDGQWTHELQLREERQPSPIAKLINLPVPGVPSEP